jgi:phenylacetate-CoA ligase
MTAAKENPPSPLLRPGLHSSPSGIAWPALPDPTSALVLALQYQFEHSQWWSPQELQAQQLRQLSRLLAHARRSVAFYKKRLGGTARKELTLKDWQTIPILTRRAVQQAGPALASRDIPKDHGPPGAVQTSGSTGQPIKTLETGLSRLFFRALNLRRFLWQGADLSGTAAAIRETRPGTGLPPRGTREDHWAVGFDTGPVLSLSLDTTTDQQIAWLLRHKPNLLLSYPTILGALAERVLRDGIKMPWLKTVNAFGEVLGAEVKALARQAWGIEINDLYSAIETGVIALQCPEHEHYHVACEGIFVEVLDAAGRPCAPGEVGRVVLTPLHNFAYPLIRYEIGDYAEVGPPCPCGRGLPVLTRILGRERNMFVYPGGERRWPSFDKFLDIDILEQFQVIQKTPEQLEVVLAVSRPLREQDEDRLRQILQADLGYPFEVSFTIVDKIPRAASGKFESARCLVD